MQLIKCCIYIFYFRNFKQEIYDFKIVFVFFGIFIGCFMDICVYIWKLEVGVGSRQCWWGLVLGRELLRVQGDVGDYGGGSFLGDERVYSLVLVVEFNVFFGEKEKVVVV